MSQFTPELQAAIDAMSRITTASDMNVLAQRFNSHMNFLDKVNARGIVKGDTVQWEYGGIVKTGKVIKVNRKTMEVANIGNTPFGSTITKIHKSMIIGKVAA